MIMFHRFLFFVACIVAFLAGVISAGAQAVASQRVMVSMMMQQPISVLTEIQVREFEL